MYMRLLITVPLCCFTLSFLGPHSSCSVPTSVESPHAFLKLYHLNKICGSSGSTPQVDK